MDKGEKKFTLDLEYTPRTINEIEVETKKPFFESITDYSMKTIVLFVKKGLKVSEDDAYNRIEKFLEEGGDLMELYILIMERLKARGFLPKAVNLDKMKEKLANPTD